MLTLKYTCYKFGHIYTEDTFPSEVPFITIKIQIKSEPTEKVIEEGDNRIAWVSHADKDNRWQYELKIVPPSPRYEGKENVLKYLTNILTGYEQKSGL